MATFDELRASRDRLAGRISKTERWVARAYALLGEVNRRLDAEHSEWPMAPPIALLLQELNRELKRDNDEAEAKDVQGR